jgi:hypothetical protein
MACSGGRPPFFQCPEQSKLLVADVPLLQRGSEPPVAPATEPAGRQPLNLIKRIPRLRIGSHFQQATTALVERIGIVGIGFRSFMVFLKSVGEIAGRGQLVSLPHESRGLPELQPVPAKLKFVPAFADIRDFTELQFRAFPHADDTAKRLPTAHQLKPVSEGG